ncbi:PTS lactose/cellobiose transporter subunit IIA [Streptococcus moroccensis]|uniref:PTS system cellobiose-specific IIA component n=1 Tax=Streptococcus moroccensis TaxID=1451356 RepID=A0ABT9YTA3_9STRE|nr:PTS lactose/cellobiose transporter subunit IIA [Streptococcus moroccensis]MDQ0223210.1 PTS system cellobiose-specific IIA component [Streptococcus moroccensis]
MDGLELVAFQIISAVGTARSCFIEAIQKAKNGYFSEAYDLIREGENYYVQGHHAHGDLIKKEANGEHVSINLLLLHAEDQLMSAESFKVLAEEFIDVHHKLFVLTNEQQNVS